MLLSSFSVGMVLIYTVVDFIYTDAIKDAISVVGSPLDLQSGLESL